LAVFLSGELKNMSISNVQNKTFLFSSIEKVFKD